MLLASLDCVADVASVSRLSILDYACVFLYHSKLLCQLVEIKYYKLSSCKTAAAVTQTMLVTSLFLFQLIQESVITTVHIINQSRKCTFKEFLWIKNQAIMGLVQYNLYPKYSVDEINCSLIADTTTQPSVFSVRLEPFSEP